MIDIEKLKNDMKAKGFNAIICRGCACEINYGLFICDSSDDMELEAIELGYAVYCDKCNKDCEGKAEGNYCAFRNKEKYLKCIKEYGKE